MKVRAVCFDYGGTLDAPGLHWLERFAQLYSDAGLVFTWEEIRAAFDHATHALYHDDNVVAFGLQPLIELHVQRQLQHLRVADSQVAARLAADFVAGSRAAMLESRRVLERLHARFRLGVVSNFYGNVDRLLDEAGIGPLLRVVVDSNRVGVSKPDPEIFALAVRQLDCEPGEVLYVGDSFDKDVVGARRAGLRSAWLVGTNERVCPQPDLVDLRLRQLGELETLLA